MTKSGKSSNTFCAKLQGVLDYLRNKPVEVGVSGSLNVKRSAADIVDGFIVEQHSHISVLQEWVSGQDTVVRLNNRGWDLRRWVNSEPKLWFLSVVHREPLQEKRSKPRSGPTTDGVEHQKALKPSTVIRKLSDPVQAQIHNLLPDCSNKDPIYSIEISKF